MKLTALLTGLFFAFVYIAPLKAQYNGFEVDDPLIPASEIKRGGPPRDGIPALTNPALERAGEVDWLSGDDRLMIVEVDGRQRAYAVNIMNYHEIVNDTLNGKPVAVTYCPLCGSGVTFDAVLDGKKRLFGVSGLLYNSDVLLYDKGTESLWSQLEMKAVSGPLKGTDLTMVNTYLSTWEEWSSAHPDGLVLSKNTGHSRDYSKDPYQFYRTTDRLMFPVDKEVPAWLEKKTRVIGVKLDDKTKAYPQSKVETYTTGKPLTDTIGYTEIKLYKTDDGRIVATSGGNQVPTVPSYWFAWYTFNPETKIWRESGE